MRGRGVLHRIVNLVIFIVLEIAMLHLVTNNADLQRIWVARASHAFMGTVWGATESVRNYFTLSADIYRTGIYLTGGGALLRGLDKRLNAKTKLPIHVADDPLRAVARGTGIALKNFDRFTFLIK